MSHTDAVPTDPLPSIAAAHSQLTTAHATLQNQVDLARSAGLTWLQIAAALGIQTTTARARYAPGREVRAAQARARAVQSTER